MSMVTRTDTQSPAVHVADSHDLIRVQGVRENNVKEVSVEIPQRRLTVFTGVSGSGKSTLAQHGISVCGTTTGTSHFDSAGTPHRYALPNCQAAQEATVLAVIPSHNKSDRDAAFIQALYRTRFITNSTSALRFGDSVVLITHICNRDVARAAISRLKDLGAR